MLKLTDTQIKILNLFLQYGSPEKGMSTYQIGKRKFSRRTFEINRDHLLENKIIQIIKSVDAGKQKREYYDMTPLGFFNLLQNLSNKELKKEVKKKRFFDFAPHISKHWTKIVEFHHGKEDIVMEVLKRSISQIELTKNSQHTEEFEASSSFELSTTIFRNRSLSMTLRQQFINWTGSDLEELEEIRSKPLMGHKLEREETIQENIINQLLFIFCFNMIRLIRDDSLLHGVYIKVSKPKKDFDNFEDEFEDYNNNCYNKMIKNNPTQKTIELLKSDKDMMKIIENNLKKWNEELRNNHPFKDLFDMK